MGASPWTGWFRADARDWILAASEPAARWLLLTAVLDRPADDADVLAARRDVLADPATEALLQRLPDWDSAAGFGGHDSPVFAPNLLLLLADWGLRSGDDTRVDALLEQMLAHTDQEGRFQSFGPAPRHPDPIWGALLCDTHAITEVLLRYGRGDDPRVRAAVARMAEDATSTPQGLAWPCRPEPVTRFRGPGRKADACPQVTLEALRAWSLLPKRERPSWVLEPVRAIVGCWRRRSEEQPYMFGHGKSFKTAKWPSTWYRVDTVLDAVGRYPEFWRGPDSDPDDRAALAELLACLVAYNLDGDGRVVPRSTFRGFTAFSFGQKRAASPFATAKVWSVLHRFDDIAEEARAVDVLALGSSKGGSGTARAPTPLRSRGGPPAG